jgi:DNA-binding IclR family transcriptional regulator
VLDRPPAAAVKTTAARKPRGTETESIRGRLLMTLRNAAPESLASADLAAVVSNAAMRTGKMHGALSDLVDRGLIARTGEKGAYRWTAR